MLPDMYDVLTEWSQSIQHGRFAQTVVDGRPTPIYDMANINAVVQVASPEQLNIDNLDYSKRYLMIHYSTKADRDLKVNDKVVYMNKDYRIFLVKDYSDYGYIEVYAEEVKRG